MKIKTNKRILFRLKDFPYYFVSETDFKSVFHSSKHDFQKTQKCKIAPFTTITVPFKKKKETSREKNALENEIDEN